MDDRDFQELVQSVRDMKAHMRGEEVPGAKVTRREAPEPASIRDAMGLSQSEFALLLGISVRTLQEWEQGRREPTGPAVKLLRIAAAHPDVLLEVA
jgi:putative transcriptional regulator